jgi:hypothetical protein
MKHFLKRFPPGADRFEGVDWFPAQRSAAPVLAKAIAYMECKVRVQPRSALWAARQTVQCQRRLCATPWSAMGAGLAVDAWGLGFRVWRVTHGETPLDPMYGCQAWTLSLVWISNRTNCTLLVSVRTRGDTTDERLSPALSRWERPSLEHGSYVALPSADPMPYRAFKLGQTVSYWFQRSPMLTPGTTWRRSRLLVLPSMGV